jgi:hypothetical protein
VRALRWLIAVLIALGLAALALLAWAASGMVYGLLLLACLAVY